MSQTDQFDGVELKEFDGQGLQAHLCARSRKAKCHRIVTLLVPQKKGQDRYVLTTFDNQGYTFSVLIEKYFA